MSSEAFIRLCEVLEKKYGLQESLNIKVDESVAIFLVLCGQNDTQHDIGLRFGHAQETIGRKFHHVLGAMVKLAVDYLRPRTASEFEAISNSLQGDKRYWPYFNGSIGALDGSTHDSRVLDTAMRDDPLLPRPPGEKYYLVDSGYANRRGYLAPYRKERKEDVDFEEATMENSGVHMHQSENDSDDENDVRGNEETSTAVYMKIVRDQIATQLWSDKRLGSRRV
ncbi:uncharacterized protein LOC106349585 [Brassica napus]|uniref:uncharacterized protein LOC106349585 n=1 Tax=Brassica napus TaxID=3708 RepID=UPI002078D80A|nr:uncharacterized protein LOC106349585 [Brassica napus]